MRLLNFPCALLLLLTTPLLGCPQGADDDDLAGDDDDDDDASGDDDDASAGDDDDDDDSGPTGPAGESLSCEAGVASVSSSWGLPSTVEFTAQGTWDDGLVEDVTTAAEWSVLEGPGGSVLEGTYTTAAHGAGVATLLVEWEGLIATCSVETYLEAVVNLTDEPALEAAVLAETIVADNECAPFVLYPLDGAMIPPDFFSPEVQWIAGTDQDTFILTFTAEFLSLVAITQDPSWTPTGDEWWAIANPAAGSEIEMTVAGGDWVPETGSFASGLCGPAWPLGFETAQWGNQGSIFYWTPNTQGLWQVDIGAETASPWMDLSVVGQCVGCHSVNAANPTLLSVTQGSGGYGASVVTWDTDPTAPIAGPGARQSSFSALDPTGTRLVRAYYGALYLDDVTLDTNLSTVPTTGWATHPNWSPDGQWLTYSSCAGAVGSYDWNGYDCDLKIMEVLPGDTFGPETSLATAPPGQSYYYPTFSPDSVWLAFNRSSAGPEVYDEPTAELMLMRASGSPPITLAVANGLPNTTNSWPRWGPITGDIGWLAFASRRPYALQTSGVAQVWVAGIDLDLAALGLDGSYAPVWLPGQDTSTGNHTPAFIERSTED